MSIVSAHPAHAVASWLPLLALTSTAIGIALLAVDFIRCAVYALRKGNDPLAIWTFIQRRTVLLGRRFHLGPRTFTQLLAFVNPYSHSIPFRMTHLSRGACTGEMREVRAVRNPFRSVHAAALVLLAETVCGLCVFTVLNARRDRAVVRRLSVEYRKKARGVVRAECRVQDELLPSVGVKDAEMEVGVEMKDGSGDIVAVVTVTWAVEIGPKSTADNAEAKPKGA